MKENTKQAIRTAGRFSRRTLVIALAIVLALGAIALAATQWHLFERISISYLTGESPVNADSVMQRDLYKETINGVEVTVDEAGYDGRILMVQYSYHFPDMDKPFGVTLRDRFGDNIPKDYLEESGGDPDMPVPGWGDDEMYEALSAHHLGWWYDSIWVNGEEVNAPGGSENGMEATKNPGEIVCTLVWRLNNNNVIVDGPIEISLAVGDTSEAEFPKEQDENGNSPKPEKGMVTFTYDAGPIQSRVKTFHPDKETVTPTVTAKVREAAFTPLMTYINLDLKVNPDAMAAFIAENGEYFKDDDGTDLWPYTPLDVFEGWTFSLELVDGNGNLIFPEHRGCESGGSDSADFIYPYLEEIPDELYLAPINDDGKGDLSQAVLVKGAD